ncbi:MAG TPA: hypothetical protein VJN68_13370 [Burkholderiaceae bacterium]|nr:hypothetical protein [Burkholderiaceae bacterium]
MNTPLSLSASLSTLALLAAFGTGAQAAQPSHDWIPAGEGIAGETMAPSTASDTTRAAVKAETLRARRSGELAAAGEASGEREQRIDESRASGVARAEVKAETLAAVHNGTIAPFGETATFGATHGGE